MARPTERDELLTAWRALDGLAGNEEGWSTISLTSTGIRKFRVGRHFPGNEEVLLVGFGSIHRPPSAHLPQGQGFLVAQIDLGIESSGMIWFALSRQVGGSLDMFTLMAIDIMATLSSRCEAAEDKLLQFFLARIRAWQHFMSQGADTTLGPEAEIGLFGELLFLRGILSEGLPPDLAIEGWVGPLDGVQDFLLGSGAVEVKTTLASVGLSARIGSLEQLDDSIRQPLYLAAIRIRSDSSGISLAELIEETRIFLSEELAAQQMLNIKLIHAGYLDGGSENYRRTFVHVSTGVFRVEAGFPRLTRATVPARITTARYEIEIDCIDAERVSISAALIQLGVM